MENLTFIASLLSIIGGVVAILMLFFDSSKTIKIITGILAILFFVICLFIYLSNRQKVFIVKPKVGSTIIGTINPEDKQLTIHDIVVRVKNEISKDEKVILLMKVQGGNEWWVTSNPVTKSEFNDANEASFGYITFGKIINQNKYYMLMACITSENFNTSEKITNPLQFVKFSYIIKFYKEKNIIKRIE